MFCREALATLARQLGEIDATGTQVAFVHLSDDAQAGLFFAEYGLADVPRVSDPSAALYRAFGLERARVSAMLDPAMWMRATATIARGHAPGRVIGDPLQMPGVFLLHNGRIVKAYRHARTSDVPDYVALARIDGGRQGA